MLVENNSSQPQVTQTSFAVKVNGTDRGTYPSRRLAEMAIFNLSPQDQIGAHIVLLESVSGKQILFE